MLITLDMQARSARCRATGARCSWSPFRHSYVETDAELAMSIRATALAAGGAYEIGEDTFSALQLCRHAALPVSGVGQDVASASGAPDKADVREERWWSGWNWRR